MRLAVDDFGTGYCSLSHLRTLPIDVLKIDRSFIAAMETSVQASTLVHCLIQLGTAVGIDTVAEGIEERAHCSICATRTVYTGRVTSSLGRAMLRDRSYLFASLPTRSGPDPSGPMYR